MRMAGGEKGAVALHTSDTVVMQNLGYFQLKANPGVWSLNLAKGRGSKLFDIVRTTETETETGERAEEETVAESTQVVIRDFSGAMEQLRVRKKKGMETKPLLSAKGQGSEEGGEDGNGDDDGADDAASAASDASDEKKKGEGGSAWEKMSKMLGVKKKAKAVSPKHSGEKVHVFSLATGALYERMLRIMMTSVTKRCSVPVKFWLLENFLSPEFRKTISLLADQIGFEVGFVSYKWPSWLRKQTEQQRIIWGYKILFLDVLFPLDVTKIIYVDADQVVRADLKELWDMDLEGKPYGYTPMCESRPETVGFGFWRQGYWKDHLQGKPYHISALYVVDLTVFRREAVGDQLRAVYDNLSRDPNSLANLDQDLPNYAQHQIEIFSLPQDWLWCESWCSDGSKATSKTIDLCNNPLHKEPKLDMAKRVISGEYFKESWVELDEEIKGIVGGGEAAGAAAGAADTKAADNKKEEL
jgi:UDP-glucose:glycoprotein glucosyltransferase